MPLLLKPGWRENSSTPAETLSLASLEHVFAPQVLAPRAIDVDFRLHPIILFGASPGLQVKRSEELPHQRGGPRRSCAAHIRSTSSASTGPRERQLPCDSAHRCATIPPPRSHRPRYGREPVIAPESLDFPPLNCSLDRTLGDYYQDVSQALILVESGYHGGVGEDGMPWHERDGHRSYSPITIAQCALANLIAANSGDERRTAAASTQLDWLVTNQESSGERAGCWSMLFDNPKYRWLKDPWISALASGNAMSALLRGWQMFEDARYRDAATAAYEALHAPRSSCQLFEQRGDELWYEEYPADPPLRVLNGHVYALLGVLDYARVSGEELAEERWRRAASTVLRNLERFDLGYWSAYELRWLEPASIHYQKNIHIPQLRILAALTGSDEFTVVADRWQAYLTSAASRVRRFVAARIHRWKPKP